MHDFIKHMKTEVTKRQENAEYDLFFEQYVGEADIIIEYSGNVDHGAKRKWKEKLNKKFVVQEH